MQKSDGWRTQHEDGSVTIFHRDGSGHDGTLLGAMPAIFRGMNQQQASNFVSTIRGSLGAETFDALVAGARAT